MALGVRCAAVVAIVCSAILSGCASAELTVDGPSESCVGLRSLTASGSSAQAIAMERFAEAYATACPGHALRYTANGSRAGIADFISGKTQFAGSETPLTRAEAQAAGSRCGSGEVWHLPLLFGSIVLAFNVFGVDSLVLDAPTVAKIFSGKITSWDAPEIEDLNPNLPLPSQRIAVVFREDESGTTAVFQDYLESAAGPAWDGGTGMIFGGVAGKGREGNRGVAAEASRTSGSITYTELSFALKQGLPTARIVTAAGSEPVSASIEAAAKSIADMSITGLGNDLVLDTSAAYRTATPGGYPIVAATYEVVCGLYPDTATASAVRNFMRVALGQSQEDLTRDGYIKVPPWLEDRVATAINAIS